ncbi:hypothetical protein CEW89_19755 [Celeribacter ethanolicus]|uniref:Uncharacterized protein n=1 Tax=Celeribacter ethanolicus TaxID=1758178 RepID=A0A291GHF0_9RHOB|nr:hypothetical protein [Celeribacter ethanolicus]ATG49607.1 hypothetical protein CEW89_19755 [Celeribacter ethanolicus]
MKRIVSKRAALKTLNDALSVEQKASCAFALRDYKLTVSKGIPGIEDALGEKFDTAIHKAQDENDRQGILRMALKELYEDAIYLAGTQENAEFQRFLQTHLPSHVYEELKVAIAACSAPEA